MVVLYFQNCPWRTSFRSENYIEQPRPADPTNCIKQCFRKKVSRSSSVDSLESLPGLKVNSKKSSRNFSWKESFKRDQWKMIKRKFLKGFNEFWFERNDLTVDTAAVVFDRSSIFLKIVPLFSWLRRPQAFSNTSIYFWCKVDIGNVYKVDLMGCCMFDARSWHCDISYYNILTFSVVTLWYLTLWHFTHSH